MVHLRPTLGGCSATSLSLRLPPRPTSSLLFTLSLTVRLTFALTFALALALALAVALAVNFALPLAHNFNLVAIRLSRRPLDAPL